MLARFLRYVRVDTQAAYRVEARPSTDKQLDLSRLQNAAGEFDETPVTVRPKSELQVFTPEHPRPNSPLTDGDAVIAQLDRQ